jgi:replicative DNA helicase
VTLPRNLAESHAPGTPDSARAVASIVRTTLGNGKQYAALDEWSALTPDGTVATQSLRSIARSAQLRADGSLRRDRPIGTGFEVLDQWVGGGLHHGELLLLGGAPGVGKTTFCLQIARNIAALGHAHVLYACYEHPADYILDRLIVQESINPSAGAPAPAMTLEEFHGLVGEALRRDPNSVPYETLRGHSRCARALTAVDAYADRFHLVANAPRANGLGALKALVAGYRSRNDQPLVLFVDYLQKIESQHSDPRTEDERVTDVAQALKQLALEYNVAIVAIAAAEKLGIQAPRLRFTHLRGSSALMYEADIAIIMNDKWQIIDRDHIVFNQHKAQQFRDWVVCTIEKNRSGRNLVEIEFMKRFEHCCFDPHGGKVSERLYEERIQGER